MKQRILPVLYYRVVISESILFEGEVVCCDKIICVD